MSPRPGGRGHCIRFELQPTSVFGRMPLGLGCVGIIRPKFKVVDLVVPLANPAHDLPVFGKEGRDSRNCAITVVIHGNPCFEDVRITGDVAGNKRLGQFIGFGRHVTWLALGVGSPLQLCNGQRGSTPIVGTGT